MLIPPRQYTEPEKVDIWALGATIFNIIVGRFPLISRDDPIPRVANSKDRSAFEAKIAKRAEIEWDDWVDIKYIPEPFRPILQLTLAKDVTERIDSADLLTTIERDLPAFLRTWEQPGASVARFSPLDALYQIDDFLRDDRVLPSLPPSLKQKLSTRLRQLNNLPGFEPRDIKLLKDLQSKLGA